MNFLFGIETSVYIRFSEKLTQSDDELIISSKYITDRALDFLPAVGFFLSPQSKVDIFNFFRWTLRFGGILSDHFDR